MRMSGPSSTELRRVLGFGFGVAVVVGGVIGQGIMRTPGLVAAQIPDATLILLAWALGGLIVCLYAMSSAELGTSIPKAGGPYAFARRAFGPRVGFVIGWIDWFQVAISTGFIAVVFAEYVQRLGLLETVPTGAIAASPVAALGLLNGSGTRISGAAQNLGSALKASASLTIVAVCFLSPGASEAAASPPSSPSLTFAGAIVAIRAIFGTFGGWNTPIYFCEEVHEPERNISRALFSGILLVVILYLPVNAAILHTLPINVIASSNLPLADAAQIAFGDHGNLMITGIALASVVTISNLMIMFQSRTLHAMARDRLYPVFLSRVSPNGTPAPALFVTVIITMTVASTGIYERLLAIYAPPLAAIVLSTVNLAAIKMRSSEPNLPRPFRMPLFPLPAILALSINTSLAAIFIIEDFKTASGL
jgi:APA family basic amino acid/polyamine antiporter